jgi:hypothetical protein
MVVEPANRAAWPVRPPPIGAELEVPPLAPVAQVDRMPRRREDEGAGPEHVRQRAGVVLGIRLDFGEGDVAGCVDELAELAIGHRRAVDPEAVDAYVVGRGLLAIMPVRSHTEAAARDEDHPVTRSCLKADIGPISMRHGAPPARFATMIRVRFVKPAVVGPP